MGQRSEKRRRRINRIKKAQKVLMRDLIVRGDAFIPSNKKLKMMEKEGLI